MKKTSQIFALVALTSFSLFAQAGDAGLGVPGVPEIDGSLAVIGLGLLSGVIAIVAERRRK